MTETLSRRRLLQMLPAAATLGQPVARAQTGGPELTAEQAQRDLRILQRAFVELHPGLYRHATPAQIEAEFAAAGAAVAQGCSRGEMYWQAARLAAAVRCGHTWTNRYNQSPGVQDMVFGRADKLPLQLRWVAGRALVAGSMDEGVKAGDELLAIDGRPVRDIAQALLPALRADGTHAGALAKRLSQLDSGDNGGAMDRLFPLRFAPQGGRWRLSVRGAESAPPRDVSVAAVALAERDKALPGPGTQWTFRIEGDVATLTLPTFAFWRSDFKPDAYLARTFGAIQQVPFLIVDQRRNEGGDDAIGRQLLAYLLRAPAEFPAYRVESAYERVPYALARYLDTWDFGFFDRTGQVTRSAGRNWRLADAPAQRVEPVAAPDRGRTVVLIGPQNSSAGFLLARAVKQTGAATLLGQTTGGNLRGLNGGELAWITLPASGVGVDIPLLASFWPGDPPDAGVEPDIAVAPRWDDAAAGIDTEMAAARAQIAAWRQRGG